MRRARELGATVGLWLLKDYEIIFQVSITTVQERIYN